MEATVILEKLSRLGVKTTVHNGRLRLEPKSRIPADLVEVIKANKTALMLAVRPPEALRGALTHKREEIATMRRRLASEWYLGDAAYQEWGESLISCLTAHLDEIRRYLREGGALALPRCCMDQGHVCLIALRRFDGCLMAPGDCGFSFRGNGEGQ